MTQKLPISATIIARNEEDRIASALKSVASFVDEIIVIDSGSTDKTVAIAKENGARVYHNAWPGYGPQKRFAEDKASHNWILNLDADERITPDLAEEIREVFVQSKADAFVLKIHDKIYGTTEVTSKPSYAPIRLYNKKLGRFSDSAVHDRVQMTHSAKIQELTHIVIHESIRSFEHRVNKLNAYSTQQAKDMYAKGHRLSILRLFFEFSLSFWRSYILKGRFKLGTLGFIHAMNYAYSRFIRLAKLYELHYIKTKK